MIRVEVGQVWELGNVNGGKFRMRIDMIAGDTAFGTAESSGRNVSLPVRSLQTRKRAARLVTNADGTEAGPPEARRRPFALRHFDTKVQQRSAGDLVKTKPPKGQGKPGPAIQRTFELAEQGLSRDAIAARTGVRKDTVAARIKAWRDWLEDQENLRAMGGS